MLVSMCLGPLLTVTSDGAPMRFGVAVSASVLEDGLSLAGRGALQWRRLPVGVGDVGSGDVGSGDVDSGDVAADQAVWIELAIVAPRGPVRVMMGGAGPSADGRGPAYVATSETRRLAYGTERVQRWQWVDGTVDERVRTSFTARAELHGEIYEIGEGLTTTTAGLAERATFWWRRGRKHAAACGLLPPRRGGSGTCKTVRKHLQSVVRHLIEMGGRRGAGDFRRSAGEVTNLEFDTTLALLRCAVGNADARAWQLALRAAGHLRDRDLDVRSGLPFLHGATHRGQAPEAGHVWLQGLLWVGLLTADDEALAAARGIGRALALRLPMGTGRNERLRDYAWPLLQLEALLQVDPAVPVAAAADRLAASIEARFDAASGTFRFGEGELGGGVYLERAWLTAGLLLPALRAHMRRSGAERRDLADKVRVVAGTISAAIGSGARGLPTHWRIVRGRRSAVHYERGTARVAWLLEGLDRRTQAKLLGRSSMRRTLAETPRLDDPDLPTGFTLLARCRWVWR